VSTNQASTGPVSQDRLSAEQQARERELTERVVASFADTGDPRLRQLM
jgi:hydroxyquinol 1,2-dioxygenase